jgi:hypothetical protein
MERELWLILYRLAQDAGPVRYWEMVRFSDSQIVGVYLWAVLHDRAVSWACDPRNWPAGLWKGKLPSQPTMSRRLRTVEVQFLLQQMENTLASLQPEGFAYVLDGKPLSVGTHSKDPDAHWGRAGAGYAKGYKLHAIYGRGAVPLEWELASLNVSEIEVASRLIPLLERGGGYLLADKLFDSNSLHALATANGYQLVAARRSPGLGFGHRRQDPGRLRCIQLLESAFGQNLYRHRNQIERQFGWLTNHAAGLAPIPAWVRRSDRVRLWVQAKIIIHAAYVHINHVPCPQAVA